MLRLRRSGRVRIGMRALSVLALCLTACAGHVPTAACTGIPACTAAIESIHRNPIGVKPERLEALLDLACGGGHALSCLELAELLAGAPALPRDEARAHAAYVRGCALGDGVSCFNAIGTAAFDDPHGARTQRELAAVRSTLTAGCDARDGRACGVLAAVTGLIDGDRERAGVLEQESATLLAVACEAGAADECEMAARQLDRLGSADHTAKIVALLHRGCELGAGEACLLLSGTDPHFADPALDARGQAALQRRACEHTRPAGCFALADQGDPAMFARGVALAEAICALGLGDGCVVMSRIVGDPRLSATDATRLDALAVRACEHHEALVCNTLAEALEHGPAARRDEGRITELKLHACTWGYPFACPSPEAALRQ